MNSQADVRHVVCPGCDAVNRVAATRLGPAAKCGRCHVPLFAGRPLELDTPRFRKHLERSDLPLLVDFWASWCGPCKMMAPAFAEAAATLEPRVRLVKIDTEREQGLAAQLGIRSIPTLILFRDGRERVRQAGAMGAPDIVRWTQGQL